MNIRRGRGRPTGGSHAREDILEAARRRFFSDGYEHVTLRSIAGEAGVDAALISYHFGSKRGLFAAVMQLRTNPPDVVRDALRGDPAHVPERILTNVLATWDDPERGAPLRTLYQNANRSTDVARLLRELLDRELIAPLADHLGGPDATARAGLASAQVAGLIFVRYVLEVEPLRSLPAEKVVELLAPSMRTTLSGTPRPPRL